jgi:hypothetical protein
MGHVLSKDTCCVPGRSLAQLRCAVLCCAGAIHIVVRTLSGLRQMRAFSMKDLHDVRSAMRLQGRRAHAHPALQLCV